MTAQLTFDDEFNNLDLRSGSSGVWSTRFWYQDANSNGSTLAGNGEQQWYINSDFGPTSSVKPWSVNNGVMTLTAAPASPEISSLIDGYKYTSGEINTSQSFSQTYGYFEMKAQLPAGQGLWPAFWLLPKDGTWPPELDVMEALGKDTSTVYTTAHTQADGSHTYATQRTDMGDFSDGYHTYAADWQADKITFYVDNKQVFQTDTPADMHKPMFMLANLAMGGGWAGEADTTTPFPAHMNIDYIRAWNENPYANGGPIPDGGSVPPTATPAGRMDGTDAADVLAGGDDHPNEIRGLAGDDRITGGGGRNEINGNQGADTLTGHSSVGDVLFGGRDNDVIDTSQSTAHNAVNGNKGDDMITGGTAGDSLWGGQGDDRIIGGRDGDWISGDRGHDTVTGGAGADVFHQFADGGVSVVTDFNAAEGDRVQLDPNTTYHVTQQGEDVLVALTGGGQVVLQHTQLSSLSDGWLMAA